MNHRKTTVLVALVLAMTLGMAMGVSPAVAVTYTTVGSTITLTAPSTCPSGGPVEVTGYLHFDGGRASDTEGQFVYIDRYDATTGTWDASGTGTAYTGSYGFYTITLWPTGPTIYRAVFGGASIPVAPIIYGYQPCVSEGRTIVPSLGPVSTTTRLSGPSRAKKKKSLKLSGTVAPGGPGTVTITMTRKVGKKWKSAGHVHVSLSGGRFSYSFKPKYKGTWHFVAKYSGGVVGVTTYLGSKSVTKTVKVK